MLNDSIAKALAIPANRATRSLEDVEHIVVLMQENRSFDHYFGTRRGVRGFGDPHPVTLPGGKPVWYQADGTTVVPPFRPDAGSAVPAARLPLRRSTTVGRLGVGLQARSLTVAGAPYAYTVGAGDEL